MCVCFSLSLSLLKNHKSSHFFFFKDLAKSNNHESYESTSTASTFGAVSLVSFNISQRRPQVSTGPCWQKWCTKPAEHGNKQSPGKWWKREWFRARDLACEITWSDWAIRIKHDSKCTLLILRVTSSQPGFLLKSKIPRSSKCQFYIDFPWPSYSTTFESDVHVRNSPRPMPLPPPVIITQGVVMAPQSPTCTKPGKKDNKLP